MPTLQGASREPWPPCNAWAPWTSGRYYFTPNATGTATSSTFGVGTLRTMPFVVPTAVTLVRIGAEVTSGGDVGSKVRLGIFADDGTGRPAALVIDAGTIAGDSATVQEITISQVLPPGMYHAATCVQVVTVTQPTLRTSSNVGLVPCDSGSATPGAGAVTTGAQQTGVTGAFPAALTSIGGSGFQPRVFVKVG